MVYAEPCTCLGRPLRFEPGSCFTCGRLLASELGTRESSQGTGQRAGALALLEAVHRTQDRLGIHPRPPAPRHNHRRVVIEPPQRALQTVRGRLGVC